MGHLTEAVSNSSKEKAPYRVLYCRKPTFIKAGDTIISDGGEVIILMDEPDNFNWATSYKAVYALEQLPWSRKVIFIDPVSKVNKEGPPIDLGKLYVNFDSPEELDFMGMEDTKYRFITGQPIQVGDKVGDYFVKRIVQVLGVKVAYCA